MIVRTLIISGRADHQHLSDACAYDAEDTILSALNADILTSATDVSSLAKKYDMAIVMGISFQRVEDIARRLLAPVRDRIDGPVVGYLFGAYGPLALNRNPVKRLFGGRKTVFAQFDRLHLGIGDEVDEIAAKLNVKASYLPMAANVLGAAAQPYHSRTDRPIALNAFGRQKRDILSAFCDRLNHPGSNELVYYTNLLNLGSAADLPRYRAMFWQLLRKSRLSSAFDHFFADEGNAHLSYVGPRWFESLAAGTVVIGRAPDTEDRRRLFDWTDAVIDLSGDPQTATEELCALLDDDARIQAASRENLVQMSRKHDWTHRLVDILTAEGLAIPDSVAAQLKRLEDNAASFAKVDNLRVISAT